MSCWTHITACLSVDTYIRDKDVVSIVENYLTNAPKITGSERDADVFVNIQSGFNSSTNCDCDVCDYKNTIIHYKNGGFSCDADDDFKCPSGKYQSCVTISIQGDLRDRMREDTIEEFENFCNYLSKKYHIRDYAINVQ